MAVVQRSLRHVEAAAAAAAAAGSVSICVVLRCPHFCAAAGLEPIDEEGPGKWADKWQRDSATGTTLHFLWNERVKIQDRLFELW